MAFHVSTDVLLLTPLFAINRFTLQSIQLRRAPKSKLHETVKEWLNSHISQMPFLSPAVVKKMNFHISNGGLIPAEMLQINLERHQAKVA